MVLVTPFCRTIHDPTPPPTLFRNLLRFTFDAAICPLMILLIRPSCAMRFTAKSGLRFRSGNSTSRSFARCASMATSGSTLGSWSRLRAKARSAGVAAFGDPDPFLSTVGREAEDLKGEVATLCPFFRPRCLRDAGLRFALRPLLLLGLVNCGNRPAADKFSRSARNGDGSTSTFASLESWNRR